MPSGKVRGPGQGSEQAWQVWPLLVAGLRSKLNVWGAWVTWSSGQTSALSDPGTTSREAKLYGVRQNASGFKTPFCSVSEWVHGHMFQ